MLRPYGEKAGGVTLRSSGQEAAPTERACWADTLWGGFSWRPFAAQAKQECLYHSEKPKTHPHTTRVEQSAPQKQGQRYVTEISSRCRRRTGRHEEARRELFEVEGNSIAGDGKWREDYLMGVAVGVGSDLR